MRTLVREIITYLLCLLSYLIPKKEKLILFLPVHSPNKFQGNLKCIYVYAISRLSEFEIIWYADNEKIYNELTRNNYSVIKGKLKLLWFIVRAEYIIIDATAQWLAFGRYSLIQVWHGTGFKKIGLLNKNIRRYYKFKLLNHYSKYKFVISSSESDKIRKEKAFNQYGNVIITGSPRNDIILRKNHSRDNLKEKLGLKENHKVISYVPTFRKRRTNQPFSNEFILKMNNWLRFNNYYFIIKRHPWDISIEIPDNLEYIKDLTDAIKDVQHLLLLSDILITDFSSIITDFIITNKPIVFYANDYEEYVESNDLYHDINKISPMEIINNEVDLYNVITKMNWHKNSEYIDKYNNMVCMFHKYLDSKSTIRSFNAIYKIIN